MMFRKAVAKVEVLTIVRDQIDTLNNELVRDSNILEKARDEYYELQRKKAMKTIFEQVKQNGRMSEGYIKYFLVGRVKFIENLSKFLVENTF